MQIRTPFQASRPRKWPQAIVLLCCLAACSEKQEKAADIRPVRVLTLTAANMAATVEFPGEVRARVLSKLAFRVTGKIIARKVDVGSLVKRGQVLMQLDPQDLQLAQRQVDAQWQAARSSLTLAQAELQRYRDLHAKNFVSQATLDAKLSALETAQAGHDQAQAAYRSQSNQLAYAVLVSDVDGVVTAIETEVGQVVAAGTPVVSVAKQGALEVVIAVPEDRVEALRVSEDVGVRLWAEPSRVLAAKVREVAPVADAATRTYAVKVALLDAPANIKLGMTAYVVFATRAASGIRVPLSALAASDASIAPGSAVWVVEHNTVRPVPVRVLGTSGNDALIAGDIALGQTVVTAGVKLLSPGQRVTLLDTLLETSPAGAAQ